MEAERNRRSANHNGTVHKGAVQLASEVFVLDSGLYVFDEGGMVLLLYSIQQNTGYLSLTATIPVGSGCSPSLLRTNSYMSSMKPTVASSNSLRG